MNAHLFQLLGPDALRAVEDAGCTDLVAGALSMVTEKGIVGRVRLADMSRPAIFQVDVASDGKVLKNPMLMVATNQEGADLIRKWVAELQTAPLSGPDDISQVIGDFFPLPPPSNDTKP